MLGDRSNTRDQRHRTLRATVEWSYDLLDEPDQRLFRYLSIFPGGLTIDCIESITERLGLGVDGLDSAGQLVDASLIMRERARSGTRYSQLETLRTFGLDQLDANGELTDAGELLIESMLQLVVRVDRGLRTADEERWVDLLREEFPNVRAARRLLADGDRIDELIDLLHHLSHWARLRDANEVWAWADDLLAPRAGGRSEALRGQGHPHPGVVAARGHHRRDRRW